MNQINVCQHLTVIGINCCSDFSRSIEEAEKCMIQTFTIDTKCCNEC